MSLAGEARSGAYAVPSGIKEYIHRFPHSFAVPRRCETKIHFTLLYLRSSLVLFGYSCRLMLCL